MFNDVVKEAWKGFDANIVNGLCFMKDHALSFNFKCFGNIFRRKRTLMAILSGIQRAFDYRLSRYLGDLDKKLIKELEDTLILEDML